MQDQPKQFRLLAGRPLLTWSLSALVDFGCDPLVIVVPEEHLKTAGEIVQPFPQAVLTAGGASRQQSVARGLERVGRARLVVVHDAARPFLSTALLQRVLDGVEGFDGAIAAEPVDETLKVVDEGTVVRTIDRSNLWRAQTPQAFVTEALRRGHERAPDVDSTDDAQLVELAGGRVVVLRGDRMNMKITFDEDFVVAESMAASIS